MSIDINFLIATGKAAMEQVVADGEDLLPVMLVESGGQLTVVGLAVDGSPVDYIVAAVSAFDQKIESVSFTSDTYHTSDPSVPRPLQGPFEAGDPRVSEALSITIVTGDTDEDTLALLPYTRTADGLVWGEQIIHKGKGLGGRVTAILRRAMAGGA